jgi:hypothetical protein
MASRACQLLATLCVALSLALFAQGSTDPTGGFYLQTLSYCRHTSIMGPVLDTVVVSHDVVGASCEKLGWHVNMCLLHPFTVPIRARLFTSSVVTPQGYKVGGLPCANLRPLAQPPIVSSPPSLRLKRKRGREIDPENRGESSWAYMVWLLLPFQTMAEQGWIPSEVTQAHLQDLMSQGFMTAVELATCHVPEDPASPASAGGYVVA